MKKLKKSTSDKEKELINIISDARKKLNDLQEKQKADIGKLAYKHGLNKFDLSVLDNAFSKIATELTEA